MSATPAVQQEGPSLKMVDPFNQEGIYASSMLSEFGKGTDQGLTPPPMIQSGKDSRDGIWDDKQADAELWQPVNTLTPPDSDAEPCLLRASCEVEGQQNFEGPPRKRRKLSRDCGESSEVPGIAREEHAGNTPQVSAAIERLLVY